MDDLSHAAKSLAYIVYYLIASLLLARLGVGAAASFWLCHGIFFWFPWNWDGPALSGTLFALTAILVCAGYGFYVAIGGRAAFAGGDQAIA